MLCFQVGLLAGYGYAHLLVSKFRDKPKTQVIIHLSLLAISFLLLPITPSEALKPTGSGNPIGGIVLLVATTVGLPYLVISASGPLLQSWFGLASGGKSPYRLYAISNLGSLLGLISYPFLFEPLLGLFQQTTAWSIGYGFYGLLAALCGWILCEKSAGAGSQSSRKIRPASIEKAAFFGSVFMGGLRCMRIRRIARNHEPNVPGRGSGSVSMGLTVEPLFDPLSSSHSTPRAGIGAHSGFLP